MPNKLFDFINNGITYEVHGVCRTARHGLSLLLKTAGGNWIVANGVNVSCEKNFVVNNGFATGDWNHGHYFMEHWWNAYQYWLSIKEAELV